jgi:signal transduction protein with GAF and PtsI domain
MGEQKVKQATRWPWDIKENRFTSLTQISQTLASVLNTHAALEKILEATLVLLKARRGFIMLVDPQTEMLSIKFGKGMPPFVMQEVSLKIGEGISGFVAQKGRPLLVDDLQTYRGFRKTPASRYESEAFFSIPIISVPLNIFGKTLGVLNISDTQNGGSFTTEDLALLSVLATEAAMVFFCQQYTEEKRSSTAAVMAPLNGAITEIQSALTAISGHAQYLMLHIPQECKAAEVLKKIVDQTNQAFSSLKQLQKGIN